MAAKARLAIVGGVAAVVAVLAVYALVAGIQGSTNGISVNEEKRGKGTVETLEFKNPVTIRLIDKDGNVASETVVYNAITDWGRQYIYDALGDSSFTQKILNNIRFLDDDDNPTDDPWNGPTAASGSLQLDASNKTCTADSTSGGATCTATFNFTSPYQPTSGGNITLKPGYKIQVGNVTDSTFTPYFSIASSDDNAPSISVLSGTSYASIQITWTISIP